MSKRYFVVWLDKQISMGGGETVYVLEFDVDKTNDEEIEEACRETLDVMIENELDTGWDEISEARAAEIRKKRTRG
jgi:hypothetical protein